ncbi:MAG TPA: AAA family ATPase [Caulobacteraceae bacterium]
MAVISDLGDRSTCPHLLEELMQIHKPECFAVTGGPGSGKTTLLAHLGACGIAIAPDNARAVIQAAGERPEPYHFCNLVLSRDVAAFHNARGLTLFDRSLVDVWGMARVYRVELPDAHVAVRDLRLNRMAFVAPPWREVYRTDAERDQTWGDAVTAYEASVLAYQQAGYDLVELPRLDVAQRAEFVIERIGL